MTARDARSHCRFDVRRRLPLAAATLACAALAGIAQGQAARPATAAPAARPAAAPAAAPTAVGLDALSDDAVMNELAGRGLNTLLNRLFDERRVPQAERDSFKSLQALRELATATSLPEAKRVRLLKECTDGLNTLKNKMTDPNQIANHAFTLVNRGIVPDVNILDYWGEDPTRQARIRQASGLVVEMMARVAVENKAKADALEGQLKSANDPRIPEYERLGKLSHHAQYAANLWSYYRIIAIDETGKKPPYGDRQAIAKPVLDYLAQFDNPESQIGPEVKMLIAKIKLRCGEYPEAIKQYQMVIDGKTTVEKKEVPMDPKPTEFQLNEAHYFLARCHMMAGKPAEAEKAVVALETWQKTGRSPEFGQFVNDIGNKSQLLMLKYHLNTAKAEAATGAQKEKFAQAADATLEELGNLNPGFRALVTEQLVTKLPENADLTKQPMSVLTALITRGDGELNKDADKSDPKVLNRGLQAATTIAAKKVGESGATAAQIENAKLYTAEFSRRLGKNAEAAKIYLDFAEDPLNRGKRLAAESMDQALVLASAAYTQNRNDPAVDQLYGRMLKVGANPPYDRPDIYYFYADRLLTKEQNLPEAIKFFAKVPKGHKKEFDARYWQMQALERLVSKTTDVAQKNQLVRDLLPLAGQVRVMAQAALGAGDAASVQKAKFRIASATLLEAELSLQQTPPQPKRTLQVLQGFEAQVADQPQAEILIGQSNRFKARALLLDQQLPAAIALIEQLANNPKTIDMAGNLVSDVVKQVDTNYRAAKQRNDRKGMAEAATLKAQLVDLFGKVAKKDPDPEKQADRELDVLTYGAAAKFEAADLQDAPAEKQRLYKDALASYSKLTPALAAATERYTKRLEAKPDDQDTAKKLEFVKNIEVRIIFNMAKCHFELDNYAEAAEALAPLLQQGKLGAAKVFEKDSKGEPTIEKDNQDYWEAVYIMNKSRYLQYKKNPNELANQKLYNAARATVLPLFSVNANVGGETFREKFLELRKELDPTGTAGTLAPPTTQPAPTPPPPAAAPPPAAGVPAGTPAAAPAAPAAPAAAPAASPTAPGR